MNLNTLINKNKIQFESQFKYLLRDKLDSSILSKAMYYGSINGGKRIRPFLVMQASNIAKLTKKDAFTLAASVELIHSYSLIHDDLPCMDDDDFRRGKLSTHKKFDEATAILAGDALHDLAFEILSGNFNKLNSDAILRVINYLSTCIGNKGLAAGQSLDLQYEKTKVNKNKILNMYKKKTAKLFEFSFSAPFILSNSSKSQIQFSKDYGILFGLIFQIIDDLIDNTSSFKKLGKTPGKDKEQGKSTLIEMGGKNKSLNFCYNEIESIEKKYSNFFQKHSILGEILLYGISRVY